MPSRSRLRAFMKFDVEGAEYELLPWLLARGALCLLDVLNIEWHLNRVPPHKRLSALALHLSLHGLLHDGCASPPKLIEHDEPRVVVPARYVLRAGREAFEPRRQGAVPHAQVPPSGRPLPGGRLQGGVQRPPSVRQRVPDGGGVVPVGADDMLI